MVRPSMSLERQRGNEDAAQDAEAHGWTELAKLHRLAIERDIVQDFLDWADGSGYTLCYFDTEEGEYLEAFGSLEYVIAAYLGIDPIKLSREKEAALDQFRAAQATP